MVVYRICKAIYAQNLNAGGIQGRWNNNLEYVIYTSESRSLATLELLASRSGIILAEPYKVMCIQLPSDFSVQKVEVNNLPLHWRNLQGYQTTQQIGANWYKENKNLVLEVPSAVITAEKNYIINTQHPDFKNIEIKIIEPYFWDERLLQF